jgi:hypothetical protein
MSKKIKNITKDFLVAIPLPNHADTYTVISHESIIKYAYAELANQGFGIVSEEYRCTHDGQIAQGVYKLHYEKDPELSLMFGWANSYNKQMRFKCAMGTYINTNGTVMIAGEMGSYSRKHTGTADTDTIESMKDQITNAFMYYDQLAADKDKMKATELTTRKQAELLGVLFAEYEILTTEQASFVRQQMDKPSFFYNGGKNTLWSFYNHVTLALQQSHPRTWMEDQRMLHWVIINEINQITPVEAVEITTPMEDPLDSNYGQPENQTNLLVQIAEIEAQQEEPSTVTLDEVIEYTDPQGNTFEAPVVETFVEELEEKMVEKVKEDTEVLEALVWETTPSMEPTPEEHAIFEAEQAQVEEFAWELPQEDVIRPNLDFDLDFNIGDEEKSDDLFL